MNAPRAVVAAITAAGASERMGRPKALLPWGKGTVLSTIVRVVRQVGLDPILVITGAHGGAVASEASRAGARAVSNGEWKRGRFSSIQAAARCAAAHSTGASLLLWPVDCPAVSAVTVRALLEGVAQGLRRTVVPVCGERRGHPILLSPDMVSMILSAPTDSNLRELLSRSSDSMVEVAVDDPGILMNFNRPDEYEAALQLQRKEAAQ